MNFSSRPPNRLPTMLFLVFFGALFLGCHATNSRIQKVQDPLEPNEIDPARPIVVQPVETNNMNFAGDESNNPEITKRERQTIRNRLHKIIQTKLGKQGIQVRTNNNTEERGTILDGTMIAYHRGNEFATGQLTPGGRWNTVPVMRMAVSIRSGPEKKEVSKFVVMGRFVGEYGGDEEILRNTMDALAEKLAGHLSERLNK